MKKNYNIFVEGVADERFFRQYISHVSGEEVEDERLVILKGWDNLKTEASAVRMKSMTANGGVNLVVVDADMDFRARQDELHWNLDAAYLNPLKDFLTHHLSVI